MQSFIMNSYEVFIHIHQGCFADTGAIVRLPQCQRSKPGGYGKISQCITTTKQKPCAYFSGYTLHSMECCNCRFIETFLDLYKTVFKYKIIYLSPLSTVVYKMSLCRKRDHTSLYTCAPTGYQKIGGTSSLLKIWHFEGISRISVKIYVSVIVCRISAAYHQYVDYTYVYKAPQY